MVSVCAWAFLGARGQTLASLDTAVASSTYSAAGFGASQALTSGAGYWCSSGAHAQGQTVAWTGSVNTPHKVVGVRISWAYAPGAFKLLTSPDGINFEESENWRAPSQGAVSFDEVVMLAASKNAQAVTILMQSPMSWEYFGIVNVALLVEPYTVMLVSGVGSTGGEPCLVADGGHLDVEACLDAIASGDGREVFALSESGQLQSAASGRCVALANGDLVGGGALAMEDCDAAADAGDGRSVWELTAQSQLRLPHMGNACLDAAPGRVAMRECNAAVDMGHGSDVIFPVAVPEYDSTAAASVVDGAAVLGAAAARQRRLLTRLQEAIPRLGACTFALVSVNGTRISGMPTDGSAGERLLHLRPSALGMGDAATQAISRIDAAFGIDVQGLRAVIGDTVTTLKLVEDKVAAAK